MRRKLSAEQVAERANISRSLLWRIEQGNPSISIGALFSVLMLLGLEKDFLQLAADDVLRRKTAGRGANYKRKSFEIKKEQQVMADTANNIAKSWLSGRIL